MVAAKRNHTVYGPFKSFRGRVTFRTANPLLRNHCQRAWSHGAELTVCLWEAKPIREFTGYVESVEHEPPSWEIGMVESLAARGGGAELMTNGGSFVEKSRWTVRRIVMVVAGVAVVLPSIALLLFAIVAQH